MTRPFEGVKETTLYRLMNVLHTVHVSFLKRFLDLSTRTPPPPITFVRIKLKTSHPHLIAGIRA